MLNTRLMLSGLSLAVLATTMWVTAPAHAQAENRVLEMKIEEALTYEGKHKIRDMPYFLRGEEHGKVAESLGPMKTNKRSRSVGRSGEFACAIAFQSAVIQLQKRAFELGANAVVDIVSVVDSRSIEVERGFRCSLEPFTANVVLTGRAVKLEE